MLRRRNNWRARTVHVQPYEFMNNLAERYNGARLFLRAVAMYFRSQLKLYRSNKSHVTVR